MGLKRTSSTDGNGMVTNNLCDWLEVIGSDIGEQRLQKEALIELLIF